MICEKCNAEMLYFTEYSSCGWRCPRCSWSIVTSNTDPMDLDETQYTLMIPACEQIDREAVKAFAGAAKFNIVESRKALHEGVTFNDQSAGSVSKIAKALREHHIVFTITPEFPYEY